jgi:hypothetical protein
MSFFFDGVKLLNFIIIYKNFYSNYELTASHIEIAVFYY